MNLRVAILALCVLSSPPAFGQALMQNFSWPEMRQALEGVGATITAEGADGADGELRYFDVKSKDGLMFTVFSYECDTKEPAQRCSGAQLAASFTPKDENALKEALDAIDYLAVDDRPSPRGNVRLTRYIIFDGGIAATNVRENISVFLDICMDVWETLKEKGLLKTS